MHNLKIGKFHAYEGHPLSTVTYPIRLFSRLGVSNIIRMCIAPPLPPTYQIPHPVTNAVGSLNPHIGIGTGMSSEPVKHDEDILNPRRT